MISAKALLSVSAISLAIWSTAAGARVASGTLESDLSSVSPAADESMAPPLQRDGDVMYRTGGVGKDERDALLLAGRRDSLKLVFAGKHQSDFVADVAVKIFDENGRPVMEATDAGPLLFANLPPGTYRTVASLRGETFERNVTVTTGKQTQLAFFW